MAMTPKRAQLCRVMSDLGQAREPQFPCLRSKDSSTHSYSWKSLYEAHSATEQVGTTLEAVAVHRRYRQLAQPIGQPPRTGTH